LHWKSRSGIRGWHSQGAPEEYARKRGQRGSGRGFGADSGSGGCQSARPDWVFNNLTLHAELTKNPLAFSARSHHRQARCGARKTSIEDIQRKIADFYKLDPRDFQSAQRSRRVARPRQVAMFLAREITCVRFPRSGAASADAITQPCSMPAGVSWPCATKIRLSKQEVDFLKQVLGKGS